MRRLLVLSPDTLVAGTYFGGVYRSDTRAADAKARLLKLRDHIEDALDESRFRLLAEELQAKPAFQRFVAAQAAAACTE